MFPYFVMVGVPAVLAFYQSQFQKNRAGTSRKIIDSFFLIWLILLLFRSVEVGTDLSSYTYHFHRYSTFSWAEILSGIFTGRFEGGYVVLSKLLSYITTDFHAVIMCCACISVIPIWCLYRKEAYSRFLTVLLFINIAPFSMYFSGLRQAMAMAFVFPCYIFCKEKNIKSFLLTVLTAVFFHRSALILLLLYPVYHLRLKRQIYIFSLLPGLALVYIFQMPLFRFLLQFVGDEYLESYGAGVRSTGAYAVLLLLTLLLLYSFLIPDREKLDHDTAGLRNLLILSTFLQVFSGVHSIAMRINYYYLLFIPLLIPRIIECGNAKYRVLIKFSIICMVLFFSVFYFYQAYTDEDILNIYPYKSVFAEY